MKQKTEGTTMEEKNKVEMSDTDEARRDFLRKSVYAACATPVIMTLLVERADAAQSWNPGRGHRPPNQSIGPDGGANNRPGGGGPRPERWDNRPDK
jgi:hypothetical protein